MTKNIKHVFVLYNRELWRCWGSRTRTQTLLSRIKENEPTTTRRKQNHDRNVRELKCTTVLSSLCTTRNVLCHHDNSRRPPVFLHPGQSSCRRPASIPAHCSTDSTWSPRNGMFCQSVWSTAHPPPVVRSICGFNTLQVWGELCDQTGLIRFYSTSRTGQYDWRDLTFDLWQDRRR